MEDYGGEHNPARAIDAWVKFLDLKELVFGQTEAKCVAGQPPYDPALLLKLYRFRYLRGNRS